MHKYSAGLVQANFLPAFVPGKEDVEFSSLGVSNRVLQREGIDAYRKVYPEAKVRETTAAIYVSFDGPEFQLIFSQLD